MYASVLSSRSGQWFLLPFLAFAAIFAVSCTDDPTPVPTNTPEPPPMTIVDIAVADGRFQTLVAAVTAAELAGTLSGDGPFTVFAPADDAFGALPEGTVEALLADIPALTEILSYHVVSGAVPSSDVVGLTSAPTLAGSDVAVRVEDGNVFINDAQVVIADIEASNGIIHVIDAVLIPSEPQTIVDIAVADGRFQTLVAAVTAADLASALSGEGPFTVFAPTDDAFAALPEGTVEALLADLPALTEILTYHVVSGAVSSSEVVGLTSAPTLAGSDVAVRVEDGNVFINDSQVVIADIEASNGIIHVIDAVLIP